MLASRGIQVWISEKVARTARGVVVDGVIDRLLTYRDASFRLFEQGNPDASFWAARAMEDRAMELDCAVAEVKETQAGRKLVGSAQDAAAEKSAKAHAEHLQWQKEASARWSEAQHKNKSVSDIAKMIDPERWNTVRRRIKRP